MSKRRLGFLVATGALALVASDVGAAKNSADLVKPIVTITHNGYDGSIGQDSGVNEQGVLTYVKAADGTPYIVEVHMSSDVPTSLGYWQCFCNSYKVTEDGLNPVASNVMVTSFTGGERNCNRPGLASAGMRTNQGEAAIAMYYGNDTVDPNTTYEYMQVLNEQCQVIHDPVKLSVSDDNDTGGTAPPVVLEKLTNPNDETDIESFKTMGTAFENGGGGRLWALAAEIYRDPDTGDIGARRHFSDVVYTNLNIARQSISTLSDGRVVVAGPVGNDRPPSVGVGVYVYDWMNQNTLSENIIAETNDLVDYWPNDPVVAKGQYDTDFVMKFNVSNGYGEDTNDKGSSLMELRSYRVTDQNDLVMQDSMDSVDMPFQTHATLCSGYHGAPDAANRSLALVSGSPTGAGQGQMHYYNFGTELTLSKVEERVISEYSDSGHQSNIYGANPNNQGRNFFHCIGDIPNPGYGVEGAFKAHVKSFWAVTMSGKEPAHMKNTQFMILSPATGEFEGDGSGPTFCDENPSDPACTSGGGNGTNPGGGANNQAGACAYSPQQSGPAGAGLLLLGLGLMAAGRRRREEV